MRLLFAGDFHGNMKHARRICVIAERLEADAIVELGDFGFVWSHDTNSTTGAGTAKSRLDVLNQTPEQFELPLYWLDGNHENFDAMASLGARTDAGSMVKLGSHVTYIPRGFVWEWDGVRFLAMGGAQSIDKEWRTPGKSWWPQELITETDMDRAVTNLGGVGVDVMLAHDAPELPPALHAYMTDPDNENGDYKCDPDSERNRRRLRTLLDQADPGLYVHGHMHHRYDDTLGGTLGGTRIAGLACDGMGSDAYLCIDTADLLADVGTAPTRTAA